MKTIILLFIFGIILLGSCTKQSNNISEIKILDKEFNIIKIINQTDIINEIKIIWMTKKEIELEKKPDFIYKIDIVSNNKSTRWLYVYNDN